MSGTLVLVRHGQSTWNRANLFTGWEDVPLSDHGVEEAREAGRLLREEGFLFDVAFTSWLQRAIKSLWIILEELDQMWIPEYKHWALNERHYGALQGLNKSEQARIVGEQQVHQWRRSWDVRPPKLDARATMSDRRYAAIASGFPSGESLKDTVERVEPYWTQVIAPHLRDGETVLLVAHGNSQRALIKIIEDIPNELVPDLELPTGIPYVIRMNDSLDVLDSGFRRRGA